MTSNLEESPFVSFFQKNNILKDKMPMYEEFDFKANKYKYKFIEIVDEHFNKDFCYSLICIHDQLTEKFEKFQVNQNGICIREGEEYGRIIFLRKKSFQQDHEKIMQLEFLNAS